MRALDMFGAVSDDSTDYDAGEKSVLLLVQYHESKGRPAQYEAAVQSIYGAYEAAKVGTFSTKWTKATEMKKAGADAFKLLVTMRDKLDLSEWQGPLQSAAGPARTPASKAAPSTKKPEGDVSGSWYDWFSKCSAIPSVPNGVIVGVSAGALALAWYFFSRRATTLAAVRV